MPKDRAKKLKKPVSKPVEHPVSELKTEETELTCVTEPQFRPIHLMHFEELNGIWPNNPRIPSVQSRRAWAWARNLNPTNVHRWWYRRRKVAAKSKIAIPKDTYELDVGIPPELPVVKEEPAVEVALLASDSTVDDGNAGCAEDGTITSGTVEDVPASATDLLCADSSGTSLTALSEAPRCHKFSPALNGVSKGAYTHSSPSKDKLLLSDPLMWSSEALTLPRNSSLPPSSPPAPSPAHSRLPSPVDEKPVLNLPANSLLILDEAPTLEKYTERLTDRDGLWASFTLLEPLYPAEFLPTKECCVSVSSCAYTPYFKLANPSLLPVSEDTQSEGDLVPDFAPWCIDGFRVFFDGSFLGPCSYCFSNLNVSVSDI